MWCALMLKMVAIWRATVLDINTSLPLAYWFVKLTGQPHHYSLDILKEVPWKWKKKQNTNKHVFLTLSVISEMLSISLLLTSTSFPLTHEYILYIVPSVQVIIHNIPVSDNIWAPWKQKVNSHCIVDAIFSYIMTCTNKPHS